MAEHTFHTKTALSKPHSFSASSSSEYTLLMNRFKLLNLVQRIAHRDVLAMIETIGLDGLHYKCTTKQSWMTDWNMNADHDKKSSNNERRQNSFADKSRQKQASRVHSGRMETKKFGNMEHNSPHHEANKFITNSLAQKHKQIHKTHTNAQRRNGSTQPSLIHHRHHKALHGRNVDKSSNVDVAWSSSPRLTEDEINELVQRLAQPRESYTIDMDDTGFTTEEDMFDELNTNFVETGDSTFKINRGQEVGKNKMSDVQSAASSITPHEPTWKQLQMAIGLMESTPLPLHPHRHKSKENKEQKDKESTIATITASNSADNFTLTSSPRPRSRTRQRQEEEEELEEEEEQEIDENNYKGNAVGSNKKEEKLMRENPLTLQKAKIFNVLVSTPSQETQNPEEHLEHHVETVYHVGSIQDASAQTAANNTSKMGKEVNTLPITPTRAIAPKAKPIAVQNTERVPINIIQHAAALVARQREQRQMELNKRQWQIKQQASKKEKEDDNKNVEQLASTQRYLPTQRNKENKDEEKEEEEEQLQKIPPSARSYSVAHGHDADKLFATGHSNTGNNDNININNSNNETEYNLQNEQTNMSKNTAAEVATTPSLLPRVTFADQRTLAKLSNTIDHMLRDHEHILHEVIADHDKTQSIKLQTENEIEKEKIAAVPKLSRESEEEINNKESDKIAKKHVKSLQGRHLHKFSAFSTKNKNNNSKHIKSSSRASTSSFTSSSLSSERGEDAVDSKLSRNNHSTSRKHNYIRRPSRRTSTDTITSSTATTTTTTTSSSADKHKDDDELLMLSRMQRTFAEMDNETHNIIARTNRARAPVIGNNGFIQTSNVNVKSTDKLHASKADQLPVISSSSSSLPVRAIAHRRRGQMPEVAVRRLNAYRVENLERIAREERRWNTSNISQFTFASRLTNALFEDCFDEVMSEVNSIMDNYVDGLAEHEMA